MTLHLQNKTISLESIESRDGDSSLLAIIQSYSVLAPQFLLMSRTAQIATNVISWMNAVVFTYFRCIVYCFILKQYKQKNITEVNILTIIVCLAQHLEIIGNSFHEAIMIAIGDDWPNSIQPLYCFININMNMFYWYYSVVGSLGIAVYRILLIKYDFLVRYKIGKRTIMWIILMGEFVLMAFFIGTRSIFNPFRNPLMPMCMYQTTKSIVQILDDYQMSLGYLSLLDSYILLGISAGSLCLILEVVEIVTYVLFFHHMYKHDNNERLKKLLGADEIKRRNSRNAMSFFSAFCSFVVETASIVMLMFFLKFSAPESGLLVFAILLRKFNLTAMAIIEVVTSYQLKSMIIGFK